MIRGLIIISVMFAAIAWANPAFEAGAQAYTNEDWDEAIGQWKSITAGGQTSAELEYNLGNAYFRKGEIERSILHYERALKLNPKDEDTHRNLVLANRAIVDQIPQAPKLGFWLYLESLRDTARLSTIRSWLLVLNALFAVSIAALYYTSGKLRDAVRRFAILFGSFAVFALFMYGWRSSAMTQTSAIVMAEKSDIYSSPTDNSTQLFSLHSGTKIRTSESLAGWTEIQLADGRKGWISSADIENI